MSENRDSFQGRTWQVELICHGVRVVLELKGMTPRAQFYLNDKYKLHNADMNLLQMGAGELKNLLENASTAQQKEALKGLYDFSCTLEAFTEEGLSNLVELVFKFLTEKSKEYLFSIPVTPYRLADGTYKETKLDAQQRLLQLILDDEDVAQAIMNRNALITGISQAIAGSFEQKKRATILDRLIQKIRMVSPGRKRLTLSPLSTAGA